MVRKAGRPNEKTEAREQLIVSARELFVVLPYEKVSTRMIAQKASVNAAMIRYYFGNKEGLFETMIRETVEPVAQQIKRFSDSDNIGGLGEVMKAYYQTMGKIPQFPRLIAQIMNMSPSDTQRRLLEKIIREISHPVDAMISERLQKNGIIHKDFDPQLCGFSFKSLMIFPFLAPPAMMKLQGIEINEDFLERLFEHNMKLLSHGFFTSEQNVHTGDNNEY
ncbi:TetR/AcrR family transcriptional regulator [Vibrio sp. HN007]|uniref:TetR/AcrR family transcriptional regulator n=1 Tax=Vibrio iocasae TaxID=3098914 RepID=UPI0035D42B78